MYKKKCYVYLLIIHENYKFNFKFYEIDGLDRKKKFYDSEKQKRFNNDIIIKQNIN
jgi:hypothetical protein